MTLPSPSLDREQSLAIVTGASSGIGAAVAERLAGRGYRLALIARRQRLMRSVADRCGGESRVAIEPLDLSQTADVAPAIQRIIDHHGPPEVLINNAAVGLYRTFLDHDPADFERLMRVNYLAAVETIRVVLPGMLRRGRGTVINVASMSTKMGPWGHAAYAASKVALVSLTQTLAAEHLGSGVHFCYVNPGIVHTEYFSHEGTRDLWPVVRKRAVEVGRVADRIVRLIDHPRLETCVPWHYRVMDWIKAISPMLALRIVARGSRPKPPADAAPEGLSREPARRVPIQ
jgi:short-subunit dehydrogenase